MKVLGAASWRPHNLYILQLAHDRLFGRLLLRYIGHCTRGVVDHQLDKELGYKAESTAFEPNCSDPSEVEVYWEMCRIQFQNLPDRQLGEAGQPVMSRQT